MFNPNTNRVNNLNSVLAENTSMYVLAKKEYESTCDEARRVYEAAPSDNLMQEFTAMCEYSECVALARTRFDNVVEELIQRVVNVFFTHS